MRVLLALLAVAPMFWAEAALARKPRPGGTRVALTLFSPAFQQGQPIPARHACTGADLSPELRWSGAPEGTQSFALVMEDPDAPVGTWVHWVVWNIPGAARGLPEGLPRTEALKDGTRQGMAYGVDRFTKLGYFGPCPPAGTHRYYFRLYALDGMLSLSPRANVLDLRKAMQGRVLASAELMGTFRR